MPASKWLIGLGFLAVACAIAGSVLFRSGSAGCNASSFQGSGREIFMGIVYGCERLEPSAEGRGLFHWIRVDLAAPGTELYVTPLDPTAIDHGWQYRLKFTGNVVRDHDLSVAINAALFTSSPAWRPRLPGDFANGVETVVSDHVISHIWEHTYLLWFDDQLRPTLERSKPPSAAALSSARWAVGGQQVGLWRGEVDSQISRVANSRTAVAIDRERQLLFLAVGENISPRLMLQKLADLGAQDGMLLDGGGSTSIAIGKGSAALGPQVLYNGWRPVATHFGVRARPAPAGFTSSR